MIKNIVKLISAGIILLVYSIYICAVIYGTEIWTSTKKAIRGVNKDSHSKKNNRET